MSITEERRRGELGGGRKTRAIKRTRFIVFDVIVQLKNL